jgi:uncharacterized membrane protein
MEKRVIGMLLTFLGIAGLIMAAVNFMNTTGAARSIKGIVIFSILGIIFFFAGIRLIQSTKDNPS